MLGKVTCEGSNQMNRCHRKFGIYLTFQSSLWTKLRVSFNNAICAESKLQKDLVDVLIQFRRNPIALACDIKEMHL